MIETKEAKKIIEDKFPELTVTGGCDYDEFYYVFEAVKDVNKTDYNCPYYAVSKNNGRVYSFTPMEDLDKFFDAMDERPLTV